MLKLSKPNINQTEINKVTKVLLSGNLVQGAEVANFERKLADFISADYVSAVSSGTSALYLSLVAAGIGKGQAVIIPAFTFPATANAVSMTGATPIIVDVDITSYNITPECIEEATENWNGDLPITALIVVHEFGCPVDMPAIVKVARKNKLTLIEDAACAMGATIQGQHVGTFGDFGCFSFHPRKTLTTGEGGAIVTSNPDFHERIKALRNHGITIQNSRVEFSEPALNFRLTDIQAAIGIAQLEKLASNLSKRRRLATLYKEALSGLSGIKVPTENPGHSWQTYMILINSADRESLITSLRQENIETNLGAQSLLKTKAYQHLSQTNSPTPNADLLYKQGLAIPFCEQYSLNEVSLVANAIERLLR